MEIGDAIKAIMKEKKVTQTAVGKMLGVGQNSVSNALGYTPEAVADRLKIIEMLGYEVVVRERRPGRRADGEIVLSAGSEEK